MNVLLFFFSRNCQHVRNWTARRTSEDSLPCHNVRICRSYCSNHCRHLLSAETPSVSFLVHHRIVYKSSSVAAVQSCFCFIIVAAVIVLGIGALFLLFVLLYSQRVSSQSCETLGELLHHPYFDSPTGSPKHGTTRKNTHRYYTTKRLIIYIYFYGQNQIIVWQLSKLISTKAYHELSNCSKHAINLAVNIIMIQSGSEIIWKKFVFVL